MSSLPEYFTLLELPVAFDIDTQALETAYFKQQRLYHPDRFVGKPEQERHSALQRSVDINQAYYLLKNPLTRAQYLLLLQGITIGTDLDSIKPSPQLLMETMEWREKVDEARDANELEKLDGSLKAMHSESVETISKAYKNSAWQTMAQESLRLGYLIKALEAIRQQKKRLESLAS